VPVNTDTITSMSQTATAQEGRVKGTAFLQDSGTVPANGEGSFVVNISAGTSALHPPTTTATTLADGTFEKFLTPSASGFTLEFPKTNYATMLVSAPDADNDAGNVYVKHLTSLTITVRDSSNQTVTDATLTLTDESTNTAVSPTTPGSYSFDNLDPTHVYTIHATKIHPSTTVPPPPPNVTIPGFTEGKTESHVAINPGTATHTITMTSPAS
jgi:hypothetical protein